MSNWISHVKKHSQQHGISYKQALTEAKHTYKGLGKKEQTGEGIGFSRTRVAPINQNVQQKREIFNRYYRESGRRDPRMARLIKSIYNHYGERHNHIDRNNYRIFMDRITQNDNITSEELTRLINIFNSDNRYDTHTSAMPFIGTPENARRPGGPYTGSVSVNAIEYDETDLNNHYPHHIPNRNVSVYPYDSDESLSDEDERPPHRIGGYFSKGRKKH